MSRILELLAWAVVIVALAFVTAYFVNLDIFTGQFEEFVQLAVYGGVIGVVGYWILESSA